MNVLNSTYKAFLVFFLIILVGIQTTYSALIILDSTSLSNIFAKEIARKGLSSIPVSFTGVRVLPAFPSAEIEVVKQSIVNDTKVYFYSDIKCRDIKIISYNPSSQNIINDNDLLDKAMTEYYNTALDTLYYNLPTLAEGIPPGSYDDVKPSGIKSLNIPQYPEVRMIKPKLLLVLIGPSNGMETSDPLLIYYFVVEVTGKVYPDQLARVLLVLSVVVDIGGKVYGGNEAGLSAYYVYGGTVSAGSYVLYMSFYGFLGIIIAVVMLYAEVDEEYKYYLYIMLIFIAQIFGFLIIMALSSTPISLLFDIILALKHWFILLFLLWTIPYMLVAYSFNASKELEEVSPGRVAIEGILFALALIFVFLLSIDPAGVIRYLVAIIGVEAIYVYIVALSAVTLFIGLTFGGLWAKLGKIKSLMETYHR